MTTAALIGFIHAQYPNIKERNLGEIVTEAAWLCDRAAELIAAHHDDPPVEADSLRAQAIGVLWAAGLHATHAEAWTDLTIETMLLDRNV